MAKKEVKSIKIINIAIIAVLVFIGGYFAFTLRNKVPSATTPAEIFAKGAEELPQQSPVMENITEEEEERLSYIGAGFGSGGGGAAASEDDGGGSAPQPSPPPPEPPPEEGETPTATLDILDYSYEFVDADTAKINSLTYTVQNGNVGITNLELLVFIYDENDDPAKKGLVRDQIDVGNLGYQERITETTPLSAHYSGNLATEKTLKITLIGYLFGQSYNLGSVTQQVAFT